MLSEVSMSVMAIPDFVAGFVYGLTGDNHLTEIEACYNGGVVIEKEVVLGIADLKHGGTDWEIQGALELALAALQIPVALNTCENMGDDLAAIEAWAAIFKDPAKLAEKAGLHYALHKNEVNADIGILTNDWDLGDYFASGREFADIATILIGPISPAQELLRDVNCGTFTLSTVEIADFLAGFMYGFTGDDDQAYMDTCFTDTTAYEQMVCTAVNDIATKDNQKVIEGIHLLMSNMSTLNGFMAGCPNAPVPADWQTVESWGTYWAGVSTMKLYATAYKNLTANISTVTADVNSLKSYYDAGNWYMTAVEASSVAKIALPVQTGLGDGVSVDCGNGVTLNTAEVADFLAGFINGFTGKDDKTYLEGCFKDTVPFETDICTVINDIETKDTDKIMEAIAKVMADIPQFQTFMADCPTAQPDLAVVGTWFKYWKAQGEMKVYATAYKNITGNMSTFQADAKILKHDYYHQDFYGAATEAATLAKLALPVPTSDLLQ